MVRIASNEYAWKTALHALWCSMVCEFLYISCSNAQHSYDAWQLQQLETAGAVWNTWDTTSIAGLGTDIGKWNGVTFVPITGKLYFCPSTADGVLVVDPMTNASDVTAIAGFGDTVGGEKWLDVTFPPQRSSTFVLIKPTTCLWWIRSRTCPTQQQSQDLVERGGEVFLFRQRENFTLLRIMPITCSSWTQ